MSASGESIRALIAAGWSRAAIGRSIGRDDSLIGQIERGRKPGNNLSSALAELLRSGAVPGHRPDGVPLPPRRDQRVRKPTIHGGERWQTGKAGRQAVRSGAKKLGGVISQASRQDRRSAFTLTVTESAGAGIGYGRSSRQGAARGPRGKRRARTTELRVGGGGRGIPASALARYVERHSGDVDAALLDYVREHVPGAGHLTARDVVGIEVSVWD